MRLLHGCLLGLGGLLSVPVLLVAIVWGLREESRLRRGKGVDVPASLHGYNVIITGSTAGIGFEAALEFYRLGAHVLIHSSNQGRANKSAAEVRQYAPYASGKATPLAVNLAHFNEVREFAKTIPKIMPRVDVLILNACRMYGLAPLYNDNTLMSQPTSAYQAPSGHDTVLSVNHLGHYLLTELLLPILAHGAKIVVMAAIGGWDGSHRRILPPWGNLGKTNLMQKKLANAKRILWETRGIKQYGFYAYHDSKFANFCYGRWLRRRLRRNATVIIHDPGYVQTTPMMARDSRAYQERHYRKRRQGKIRLWHAPTEDAGRHLLEATFVAQHPVPDVVTTYFFPRQILSWFAPYEMEDRKRAYYVSEFSAYQRLTWGLHAGIGPQCDEGLQERLMSWSAEAVAPGRP